MFLLLHLGVAAIIAVLLGFSLPFTLIGSTLPDLIDKPMFLLGITPEGRFIAHTIFFAPIVSFLAYAIFRNKYFALSILIGGYIHLILDMGHFIPLFYPIVSYDFKGTFDLGSSSFILITETIGAILLYGSVKFKHNILYYRDRFLSWITNSKKYKNYTKKEKMK
jgi:hypothetical protein